MTLSLFLFLLLIILRISLKINFDEPVLTQSITQKRNARLMEIFDSKKKLNKMYIINDIKKFLPTILYNSELPKYLLRPLY
tara:strand:- start:3910 stop:4152 length:243 start_codon:yes stop_codon:yes gene_type:complete